MQEQHSNIVQALIVILGSLHALTFNQWISLGVLVTGLGTLLINWYYKQKHLELARNQRPAESEHKTINLKSK